MFCVKIAGVVVEVDNRYERVRRRCQDYIVTGEAPAITVRAEEPEPELQRRIAELPEPIGLQCLAHYESEIFYRNICASLVDYDAFLMHSVAIEVGGHALAFAAKSGVGKSTHIRLWRERFGREVHIINGDKPIYRFIDGRLYACGTPWRGKEKWGRNAMAPLKALCFIERGTENHIEPFAPAEAISRLFNQVLLPKEPERVERFLVLLDRMLKTVPCYRLQCDMSPEAAEVSRQGLMGGDAL